MYILMEKSIAFRREMIDGIIEQDPKVTVDECGIQCLPASRRISLGGKC